MIAAHSFSQAAPVLPGPRKKGQPKRLVPTLRLPACLLVLQAAFRFCLFGGWVASPAPRGLRPKPRGSLHATPRFEEAKECLELREATEKMGPAARSGVGKRSLPEVPQQLVPCYPFFCGGGGFPY